MTNPTVSIVIVCMNNLKNLYPCLESIKKYTTVNYETLVTAYLFTPENLKKVKEDFPWVTFIESNEIRGFSENNNLALRQARGRYCFVLNDDTYMEEPVIDRLVETIEQLPEDVAVVSPRSVFPDGTLQSCGRPEPSFSGHVLGMLDIFKLRGKEQDGKSKYHNQPGIFETATVVGAFFLIKTDIFREVGYFNETYFFCPEDVELGIVLRKRGYKLYVNSDITIVHIEGGTNKVSKVRIATNPAGAQGSFLMWGTTPFRRFLMKTIGRPVAYLKHLYWRTKIKEPWDKAYIMSRAKKNVFDTYGSKATPKEIFIKYYNTIKK